MNNIERIEKLVVFQNLYNREKEIKNLYAEEEKKVDKFKQENDSLSFTKNEMTINVNEMNKKINEELGKRDEINKRINSLDEGKDKIKIARQIKSWEKEMEKQQQELSLIQAQIDYDTSKQLEIKNELEKILTKIEENSKKTEELENHINSITKEHKGELEEIESKKDQIRTDFDIQFIEYFESLLKKTNGFAIVEVDQDACAGCFTVLPTILQGELGESMKAEDIEIHQCPHCFRYLFYQSWFEK
jgi:predicted  nucleic acid-binding Zn-ribbon protein